MLRTHSVVNRGTWGGPGVEVEDGQLSNLGIQATPNCGTCRKGKTSRILKTPISSGHQPCHGRGGVDGGRVMVMVSADTPSLTLA